MMQWKTKVDRMSDNDLHVKLNQRWTAKIIKYACNGQNISQERHLKCHLASRAFSYGTYGNT